MVSPVNKKTSLAFYKGNIMEGKKSVKLILKELGISVTLTDIQVDDEDPCVLSVEYDFDPNCGVSKEDIDKELERVIIEALEKSVKEKE
jgi:hypothetical protein